MELFQFSATSAHVLWMLFITGSLENLSSIDKLSTHTTHTFTLAASRREARLQPFHAVHIKHFNQSQRDPSVVLILV